jgi:hypothetical protein
MLYCSQSSVTFFFESKNEGLGEFRLRPFENQRLLRFWPLVGLASCTTLGSPIFRMDEKTGLPSHQLILVL